MAFVSVPNSFIQNTLIESSQMNANFEAIEDALSGETANLDIEITGDLTVGGEATIAGDASIGGDVAVTGIIKGYPYNIEANFEEVGNEGGGLDVLHSFELPANSLANDGDNLRIAYGGTLASNDNDKRIRVEFDEEVLYESGAFDLDGGAWTITVYVVRTSATTVVASAVITEGQVVANGGATAIGAGTGAILGARNVTLTVSDLNQNAVVIRTLAAGAENNDIMQNLSLIDLVQR